MVRLPRMPAERVATFVVLLSAVTAAIFGVVVIGIDTLTGAVLTIIGFTLGILEIPLWNYFETVRSRRILHTDIKRVVDTAGLEYTPTAKENWECALHMMRKLGKDDIAYDVSSHRNIPQFDEEFIRKLNEGATFYRMFCFDPQDPAQEDTKNWFREMMTGAGHYSEVSKAIKEGRMVVCHIPQIILSDFFIIEKRSPKHFECVIGFLKEPELRIPEVYTSGIHITKMELADDFKHLFKFVLWPSSKSHIEKQKELRDKGEPYCPCLEFYDEGLDRLVPNPPATFDTKTTLSDWTKKAGRKFISRKQG